MKLKPQYLIIGLFLVFICFPSIGAGDVSLPWESRDYHVHADASYWNENFPPYSEVDSMDAYSPPLPLPINASASVSKPGSSGPYQWSNGASNLTESDMQITISVFDQTEGSVDGSASNDVIGSFFATTPVFQFSYFYDYDISVYCGNYPFDYNSFNDISATLKVIDKTDSVILYDGPIMNASIGCESLINPGTFSDVDNGSGVITVPVIVGHEIEVEFGNSGSINASGCTASGDTTFTLQYDSSQPIHAVAPVPWNSEDFHVHGNASYWGDFGSDSDSCDAYSPPLQLPINCSASVSLPGCPFGPPWASEMCQTADGYGAITNSEMVIDTSVYDIIGDPWSNNFISDASASASDDFTGSFTATHDLFEFSYSYDYSMGTDCCGVDPNEAYTYGDSSISGWLTVTDVTDSVILLNTTFLDAGLGCSPFPVSDSGSDSNQLSVPVTVGHDIEVKFGIDGYGSASGSFANSFSDLTLQYDTAMRCIDPPVINNRTYEYFSSLLDACNDPDTVDEDVIKLQAVVLTGNLDLSRNISVAFESGYNCAYSDIIGKTTIIGNMTVTDGTVTIQDGTLELI